MGTYINGDNVTIGVQGDGARGTFGAIGQGATGNVVNVNHDHPAPADDHDDADGRWWLGGDKPKGRHAK